MIKVKSPANIAFVKHWGMSANGMPLSPSVSMNLSDCFTISEFVESEENIVTILSETGNEILLDNHNPRDKKIFEQICRFQEIAESKKKVKIISKNNFPTKSGIASSASGFSALTFGLAKFYEVEADLIKLTAKMGSISAVRSLQNGFSGITESLEAIDFNNQLNRFDLCDLVLILESGSKEHSSLDGQKSTSNSPLFAKRIEEAKADFELLKFGKFNFSEFGKITEKQALLLHLTTISAEPPIQYFSNKTLQIIQEVWHLREQGLEVYFTIDAGSNIHLICNQNISSEIIEKLEKLEYVEKIIKNISCNGTHLFN